MRRVGLSFVGGLLLVGGCWQSTEVLGELDSPAARIVRIDRTEMKIEGTGHYAAVPTGLRSSHRYRLEVEGYDGVTLNTETWGEDAELELVADPAGARIAYRAPGESYRVAYLASPKHVFVAPDVGDTIDWAKVDDLATAAPGLFADRRRNEQKCVIEEFAARGEDAVAGLLAATVEVPSDDRNRDPWTEAAEKLTGAARARVDEALTARLRGEARGEADTRALSVVAPTAVLADRYLEIATDAERLDPQRFPTYTRALALRAAAVVAIERAGAAACEILETGFEERGTMLESVAQIVLAAAARDCPAMHRAEDVCAAHGNAKVVVGEIGGLTVEAWIAKAREAAPLTVGFEHERIAAWDAAVRSDAVARGRERASYAIDRGEGPPCHEALLRDAPCTCDAPKDFARFGCAGMRETVSTPACTFDVDEAAKRFVRPRRARTNLHAIARGSDRVCVKAHDAIACWRDGDASALEPVQTFGGGLAFVDAGDSVVCGAGGQRVECATATGTIAYAFEGRVYSIAVSATHGCTRLAGALRCFELGEPGAFEVPAITGHVVSVRSDGERFAVRTNGGVFVVKCAARACAVEATLAEGITSTFAVPVANATASAYVERERVHWRRGEEMLEVTLPRRDPGTPVQVAVIGRLLFVRVDGALYRLTDRVIPADPLADGVLAMDAYGDRVTVLLQDRLLTWRGEEADPTERRFPPSQ